MEEEAISRSQSDGKVGEATGNVTGTRRPFQHIEKLARIESSCGTRLEVAMT